MLSPMHACIRGGQDSAGEPSRAQPGDGGSDAVADSEVRQRERAVRTREEHVVLYCCCQKGFWGLLKGKALLT